MAALQDSHQHKLVMLAHGRARKKVHAGYHVRRCKLLDATLHIPLRPVVGSLTWKTAHLRRQFPSHLSSSVLRHQVRALVVDFLARKIRTTGKRHRKRHSLSHRPFQNLQRMFRMHFFLDCRSRLHYCNRGYTTITAVGVKVTLNHRCQCRLLSHRQRQAVTAAA